MPKKNIFIIGITLLLIAGGAIGGYLVWQGGKKAGSPLRPIESNNQIQQPASQPASSVSNLPASSPSDSDISNWKTFRGDKLSSFLVKYPNDWKAELETGGGVSLIRDKEGCIVNIYPTGTGITDSNCAASYIRWNNPEGCKGCSYKLANFKIDNTPVFEISGSYVEPIRKLYVFGPGNRYLVSVLPGGKEQSWKVSRCFESYIKIDSEEEVNNCMNTFHKILSTFKFTAGTANPFLIYHNTKYGFEFGYPKDWSVIESKGSEKPYSIFLALGPSQTIQSGSTMAISVNSRSQEEYLAGLKQEGWEIVTMGKVSSSYGIAGQSYVLRKSSIEGNKLVILVTRNGVLYVFSGYASDLMIGEIFSTFRFPK